MTKLKWKTRKKNENRRIFYMNFHVEDGLGVEFTAYKAK